MTNDGQFSLKQNGSDWKKKNEIQEYTKERLAANRTRVSITIVRVLQVLQKAVFAYKNWKMLLKQKGQVSINQTQNLKKITSKFND